MEPIEHIKVLCTEIGPRGPTTDDEAHAAAYAAAKLEQAGARDVSVETFWSVPSLWWAHEIALALTVVSTWVFFLSEGKLPGWSVLLCVLSLVIIVGEFSFWRFSLSSLLPKRLSQNVSGKIPPRKEIWRRIVVIGHLDTNRTPLLFHRRVVRFLPGLLALGFACVILKIIIFAVGTAMAAYKTAFLASLILDVPILAILVMMLHGDLFTPFTEGANDNATGAAVALSLAELFANEPLEQTEYWALCTGCEEATLTGIKAFLDRHEDELKDAYFIDLECVGIGELRYATYEGMLKKYYSNSGLVRAAADAAKTIGESGITGMPLKAGYTETAIVLKRGLRGITIMTFPEGSDAVPHWHQVSDRIGNIDPETVNRAMRYVAAIARELDSE